MSSKTVVDLMSDFPAVPSGTTSWVGNGNVERFTGIYIGENIVLTAAHPLFDTRYTVDASGVRHWTLVSATHSGLYNSTKQTITPWTVSVPATFTNFINSDFAADRQPFQDSSIANYDIATMAATTSVATRDLIGAGVFFGAAGTNGAAVGSPLTLEYRLNGTYGSTSGTLQGLSPTSATGSFTTTPALGTSGGSWESGFRSIDPSQKYIVGVQSGNLSSQLSAGALLTPDQFYNIMNSLASGKSGSQAAQPTNYLHGSDGVDTLSGTFRPDVIYGNVGNDTITDGEVNTAYWSNDFMFGGPGDDRLVAGRGNDLMHGGDRYLANGSLGNVNTDGNDTATYETMNANKQGISVVIGNTAATTLYQNDPNFSRAFFVTDKVTGDVDTLISVETLITSAGSDTVTVQTLNTPRIAGMGNTGGLTSIVFNGTKSTGEVDTLDLSTMSVGVMVNLTAASFTGVAVPIGTYTVDAHTLKTWDGSGVPLSVANPNFITSTANNDLFVGSSMPETFQMSAGQDSYYVQGGDTIYYPDFVNMSLNDAWAVWDGTAAGISSTLLLNGTTNGSGDGENGTAIEMRRAFYPTHEIVDTGDHNAAYTGDYVGYSQDMATVLLTLHYDAYTMTGVITDLRDGSTLTLDNWVLGNSQMTIFNAPPASSAQAGAGLATAFASPDEIYGLHVAASPNLMHGAELV